VACLVLDQGLSDVFLLTLDREEAGRAQGLPRRQEHTVAA